jgi:hypothetical protein
VSRTNGAGIVLPDKAGVSRLKVQGSTIQDYNCDDGAPDTRNQNQAGIAIWSGNGSGHTLTGNTIVRRVDVPGTQRGRGNGIWFKSDSELPSGGGHTVTDNIIIGGYDGIGTEVEEDVRGGFDRDSVIARNAVRDCQDDGIQVEGGSLNVYVQDNVISGCGVGIALNPVTNGPLYIERNHVTGRAPGGPNLGVLACFKVGSPGSGIAYLTENVCDIVNPLSPTQGNGVQQTNTGVATYIVTGNRFTVGRYAYLFNTTPTADSRFEGNCFASASPTFVQWGVLRFSTLPSFTLATGADAGGSMGPCN